MDLTGLTLGRFQIESLLGRGSMAEVYQARQLGLDRFVALKVLVEGQFTPGEQIKRFLREAKALGRLEHPNIVPVYAQGEQAPYSPRSGARPRGGAESAAGPAQRPG